MKQIQRIRRVTSKFRTKLNNALNGSRSRKQVLKKIFIVATLSVVVGSIFYVEGPPRRVLMSLISKLKSRLSNSDPDPVLETSTNVNSRYLRYYKIIAVAILLFVAAASQQTGDISIWVNKEIKVDSRSSSPSPSSSPFKPWEHWVLILAMLDFTLMWVGISKLMDNATFNRMLDEFDRVVSKWNNSTI